MATKPMSPLKLGGGRIRFFGREAGQILNPTFRMRVGKQEHMTNFTPVYRKDAILAVTEEVDISAEFQHIIPFNVNLSLGQMGYSAVPIDRRLGGPRLDPGTFGASYTLAQTEYPIGGMNPEGQSIWSPLQYPMVNPQGINAPIPKSVFGRNIETPAAIIGYRGVTAVLEDTGVPGIPTNLFPIPIYAAGDDIEVTVTWDPVLYTPDTVRFYVFTVTYDSTYDAYIGTWSTTATVDPILYAPAISGGEQAAGQLTRTLDLGPALLAGTPTIPVTVTRVDTGATLQWLTDFEFTINYQGGSAIRRVPTSTDFVVDQPVKALYYWDAGRAAELPIGSSGVKNPVVPVTIESMFQDNESKVLIHFHAVQTRNDFQMAFSERDWMGLPFAGEALERESAFPNYPFGFIQFFGPIADKIKKHGNIPYGQGLAGFPLESDATTWS